MFDPYNDKHNGSVVNNDITTYNKEELQQKTHLGTVTRNNYIRRRVLKQVALIYYESKTLSSDFSKQPKHVYGSYNYVSKSHRKRNALVLPAYKKASVSETFDTQERPWLVCSQVHSYVCIWHRVSFRVL